MPDAAPGIGHVAGVPWDDMEMELGAGLAGGGAVVEVETEGVRRGGDVQGQVLLCPTIPGEEAGRLEQKRYGDIAQASDPGGDTSIRKF